MIRLRHLTLLALCSACGALDAADDDSPAPSSEPTTPISIDLDAWQTERIALPPDFAPSMPAGDELLLFAPGMFDPTAEDFWSYAFVMQLERGGYDEAGMTDLFEAYYDGLLLSVAGAREQDIAEDPAAVSLKRSGSDAYVAEVQLIEPFVTLAALSLSLRITVESATDQTTFLRVTASPQPAGHAIWSQLEVAAASLEL